MNFFNFFRKKNEEMKREQRRQYVQELKNTPHEKMFKALREEGGILNIKELYKSNQLTYEIISIWYETLSEMLILSFDFEKMRCLCDTTHMYFIRYEQYQTWDNRLKIFLDTLASLSSLNSFSIVNNSGLLLFLNPMREPVDTSNDEAIRKEFKEFFDKLNNFM